VPDLCDQLVAAAKYIDKQRLGSTDDCGFSPFSIDTKPNHGSPDYARDIAFQKIANRVAGTKMAVRRSLRPRPCSSVASSKPAAVPMRIAAGRFKPNDVRVGADSAVAACRR
jgi:hypothetical protein